MRVGLNQLPHHRFVVDRPDKVAQMIQFGNPEELTPAAMLASFTQQDGIKLEFSMEPTAISLFGLDGSQTNFNTPAEAGPQKAYELRLLDTKTNALILVFVEYASLDSQAAHADAVKELFGSVTYNAPPDRFFGAE